MDPLSSSSWWKISLILCTFGFLSELRPSEPFVTDYIIEYKNVTVEEIIHVAFPVSTYTSLASLAVILLITDLLRYKPIVVLEGICHVLAWGILTLTSGLIPLIIVEVFYGIAGSAALAYSTYIYAKVDKADYKKVTSQTRSARLAGKFFGGLVAQVLITFQLMNYHQLNYITLACISVGALATLFLPSVKSNKQYFLKSTRTPGKGGNEVSAEAGMLNEATVLTRLNGVTGQDDNDPSAWSIKNSLQALLLDLKTAYGNGYVLKWSIWWAVATAGQYQVLNYIQALWDQIREDAGSEEPLYNGAVKAMHTFLSALLSYGIGYIDVPWKKWGEGTLTLISVAQGLMLIWMAKTNSLYLAYLSYIIFRTIHPVMLTVASAEVAGNIRKDSYALIFGINMFIALFLQTLLTIVVADMKGLALDERSQYIVYGKCFIVLGVLIGTTCILTSARRLCQSQSHTKNKPSDTIMTTND